MKSVLVAVIVCLVIIDVFCSLENEWSQFKLNYNKKYKSQIEDARRFSVFKKNLIEITRHNRRFKKRLETFEKGITVFADLTKKQFDKKYGLGLQNNLNMTSTYGLNSRSPDSINFDMEPRNREQAERRGENVSTDYLDWREKGAVTHVKEQGVCGACWIFSAIGMLEGYNFIKTGQLISLSEQNVVDCFSDETCYGGYTWDAILHVKNNGISKETDYPYRKKHTRCKKKVPKIKIDFKGFDFVNETENDLKSSLAKYGPIGVSLYVSGNWRLYKRGVWYEKNCSTLANHSVLLVGYGTENGEDYWLIKNSWGPLWGEDGYIKIARNKEENYCGLTNEAMYIF